MMGTNWAEDLPGIWTLDSDDGPVDVKVEDWLDFPPLVEAQAENARLRAEVDAQQAQARHAARRLVEVTADRDRLVAERDRLLGIVADFASCGCWNPCTDDTDPDDLELIREALGRKDNE